MANHPNRNAPKIVVYMRDAQGLLSRHVVAGMIEAQHRAQYSVGPETDVERLRGWPENYVRWHGHVGYATTVSFAACEVSPGGRGGWTVCMREGSRQAGYINRATDAPGGLTMHEAQAMAESFGRDFARHGLLHDAREVV